MRDKCSGDKSIGGRGTGAGYHVGCVGEIGVEEDFAVKFFISGLFILTATLLSWFNPASAIILICACLLVALFPKFESIVELSFGPLKAKLERTVSESEKLLSGLRSLALAQSKALVSASAHTGRFATKDSWIFHASKDIEAGLRAIGMTEDELRIARSDLVRLAIRDIGAAATNGSYVPTELGDSAVTEWQAFRKNESLSDPDFLQAWLERHEVYGEDQKKLIEAMRWIIEHQDLKDEEQFLLPKSEYKLVKSDMQNS
jgi:hypothetical protein